MRTIGGLPQWGIGWGYVPGWNEFLYPNGWTIQERSRQITRGPNKCSGNILPWWYESMVQNGIKGHGWKRNPINGAEWGCSRNMMPRCHERVFQNGGRDARERDTVSRGRTYVSGIILTGHIFSNRIIHSFWNWRDKERLLLQWYAVHERMLPKEYTKG